MVDRQPCIADSPKSTLSCSGLEVKIGEKAEMWNWGGSVSMPFPDSLPPHHMGGPFTLRSSVFSAGWPVGSTDSPFSVGKIMPCVNSVKIKPQLLEVIS